VTEADVGRALQWGAGSAASAAIDCDRWLEHNSFPSPEHGANTSVLGTSRPLSLSAELHGHATASVVVPDESNSRVHSRFDASGSGLTGDCDLSSEGCPLAGLYNSARASVRVDLRPVMAIAGSWVTRMSSLCHRTRSIECMRQLVKHLPVVVFSKSACPFCLKAKEALKECLATALTPTRTQIDWL
jgi:hypothetical protein